MSDENESNPRKFWDAIKSVYPNKAKPITTVPSKADELKSTMSKFSEYFTTVIKSIKELAFPLINFAWRLTKAVEAHISSRFTMGYVSKIFIEKELRKLKRKKATGIDEFPPGLLKDCAKHISRPLCYIININLSLNTSTVPTIWKHARITPIFKSGKTSEPCNYRPISVLPVISKILKKAVHQNLMDYLENEKLLNSKQYGSGENDLPKWQLLYYAIGFVKKSILAK